MTTGRWRYVPRAVALVLGTLGIAACLCGCATTDESDLPWNAPQSWEGAPSIPGFNRY